MSQPIVIVGAGLAGLACGRRLHQVGIPVLILDQDSRAGGRLKTDVVEGFRLDRGFQVFFAKYPHAKLELNYEKLDFRKFEPGSRVWDGKKFNEVHRDDFIGMALTSFIPTSDKFKIIQWTNEVCDMTDHEIWSMEEMSAESYLLAQGFSSTFIRRFVVPFFGGVFLDRSLNLSNRPLVFMWKMLGRKLRFDLNALESADTVIPALGMEEIPRQIAADLPSTSFRFNTTAASIQKAGGRVTGVVLTTGEVIPAETVVVATDAWAATQMTGIATVTGGKGCTTVHYAASKRPIEESILMVNGEGRNRVSHVAVMSTVSPALAPPGQHLIAATCLGALPEDNLMVAKNVRYELEAWFPKADVGSWRPLRVDRLPYAQMPQTVGLLDQLPGNLTGIPGLLLAGEYTTYAGIDGAFKSGQQCASAILSTRVESLSA